MPVTDIVSFAFDRQRQYDEEKRLFISAEDPSQFLTANQTVALVRKLIAGLQTAGLQRGDAVLLHLANHYMYGALFFAIIGAGGICCGTNPAYQAFELNHLADLAAPRFIITSEDCLAVVLQVCKRKNIDHTDVFTIDSACRSAAGVPPSVPESTDLEGIRPLTDLLKYGEADWIVLDSTEDMKKTMACYYSTSGTTGLPKLAMFSHYALVAQQVALQPADVPFEVIRLACLPLFHVFGAAWALFSTIRMGQPVLIMSRFDLASFVGSIASHAVSETYVSPPIVHSLNRSGLPLHELLVTLRYVGVGGAPINAHALGNLKGRMHADATVSQVWGMTEFGVATLFPWGEKVDGNAIGRLLKNYDMRLVDSEGAVITSDGKSGELFIRTPGVMTGYRNMPAVAEGEWFRTGDLAHTKDGVLYVDGRAKEIIKVRGWQVAPAEIEAVLLQHPHIADCSVVGTTTDDGLTEVPRAYVVREKRPQSAVLTSAEDVFNFARQRLASYKRLDGGVVFVDGIPRTASGKTQRFKLFQMQAEAEKV
ncbi:hypothetical protein B0H63DRAFT_424631 [Podospora didyma]|uniref:Uncharacterized protein n=1 Tax=Podospora didyma TaxID=330526 RepID=A0AAE0U6K2_9PEZI|nr:hypothetical protein B0H63DRAFT_424631 [Podospora didyma]